MKKIMTLSLLLLLASCGSKDKPSADANPGSKTEETKPAAACSGECLNAEELTLEFNADSFAKSDTEKKHKVSLCKDDDKTDCKVLDELTCKDNACYSALGVVGMYGGVGGKVLSFRYDGLSAPGYKNILREEITE